MQGTDQFKAQLLIEEIGFWVLTHIISKQQRVSKKIRQKVGNEKVGKRASGALTRMLSKDALLVTS